MHSVVLARWAHAVRMQTAYRARMLKNRSSDRLLIASGTCEKEC